jgi:hypothetical protein
MAEMWKPQPLQVYRDWINDIMLQASDNLSDWENSFIANITMRLDNLYALSEGQAEKLEQIYVKHTK